MKTTVAYRIKNARLLNNMTLQSVADEIGVSKQMVSKYEKGLSMPESKRLIALANLFNQKVDYFFRTFNVDFGEINFRKKSAFSKRKINSIKEEIRIHLENYLWIEDILSFDYTFEKEISGIEISDIKGVEKAVLKLRKEWDIGMDPIHNITQLFEDKKIKVIELDVDTKFDGLATFVDDKYPVIVVNANFPIERKRFTLLHELGHLLLNIPDNEIGDEEFFCNKFASEFLLPKTIVIDEFGGRRSNITISELKSIQRKYGISIPAIMYRLVDAHIIPKDRIASFYKSMNSNKGFKDEINETRFITPEKSNRYKRLIYRALAQEYISMSKASSLLNVDVSFVKEDFALI